MRAALRADLQRLTVAASDSARRCAALEDVIARGMLEAGRAVVREPVGGELRERNVEAEVLGASQELPSVVVGARYDGDDPSAIAMQLALVRALGRERLRRTLRFVAFTRGGAGAYVERLHREGKPVDAAVTIGALGLSSAQGRGTVLFIGNLRSSAVARTARDAFRASSRLAARALALPIWFPGLGSSEPATFWKQGVRAILATDRAPWLSSHRRDQPDADGLAAAVPGLAAALVRLGGRI